VTGTECLIATRQAERGLKAGNCAPFFRSRDRAPPSSRRNAAQHFLLLLIFYTGSWCPGVQPGLANRVAAEAP
jgi:hypothetical protein